MTGRSLDDVEHIRHLLTPERAARRPVPAEGLPGVHVRVDDRPAVVYSPGIWEGARQPYPPGPVDQVAVARGVHAARAARAQQAPDAAAVALAARRMRALARLAACGVGEPPARAASVWQAGPDGRFTR